MERVREDTIVAEMMTMLREARQATGDDRFQQTESSVRAIVRRFAAVDEIGDAAAQLETERGVKKTEIWAILAPYLFAAGPAASWAAALGAMSDDDRRALELTLNGVSLGEALDRPEVGRSNLASRNDCAIGEGKP